MLMPGVGRARAVEFLLRRIDSAFADALLGIIPSLSPDFLCVMAGLTLSLPPPGEANLVGGAQEVEEEALDKLGVAGLPSFMLTFVPFVEAPLTCRAVGRSGSDGARTAREWAGAGCGEGGGEGQGGVGVPVPALLPRAYLLQLLLLS